MRGDFSHKHVDSPCPYNHVNIQIDRNILLKAVRGAMSKDHMDTSDEAFVKKMRDYVLWPTVKDNIKVVGGAGNFGYRCVGDLSRSEHESQGSWAEGVMIAAVATAGASRKISALFRLQHADRRKQEIVWTGFVQKNLGGVDRVVWLEWMDSL